MRSRKHLVREPALSTLAPTARGHGSTRQYERLGRTTGRQGVTALELVLVVMVVCVLTWGVLAVLAHRREAARHTRCMSHLNCLAKGMATYLVEHGDNRWYPCPLGLGRVPDDYNGAEWVASAYWSGVHPDPDCTLCPSSGDSNRKGLDLGARRASATFGSQTVSYAALHYYSMTDASGRPMPGALRDDFPSNAPMASDDTQGTVNHAATGGGMNVLFADSHAEKRTRAELDPERAVGRAGGLLWQLRN